MWFSYFIHSDEREMSFFCYSEYYYNFMKRAYNNDLESSFLLSSMMKVFSMKAFATDLKCNIGIRKSSFFLLFSYNTWNWGKCKLAAYPTKHTQMFRPQNIFDVYRSRLCYSLTLDKHQQASSVKAGKGETIRSSVVQQIKIYTENHWQFFIIKLFYNGALKLVV